MKKSKEFKNSIKESYLDFMTSYINGLRESGVNIYDPEQTKETLKVVLDVVGQKNVNEQIYDLMTENLKINKEDMSKKEFCEFMKDLINSYKEELLN